MRDAYGGDGMNYMHEDMRGAGEFEAEDWI